MLDTAAAAASLTRVTSVIIPYGVLFANSNACTLSLVQFDDPAGNKLVLEGYWELRGDILTRGRGRCVAKALQRALESVT